MKYHYMNVYKDVKSNRIIFVAHAVNTIGVALSTNKIEIVNSPYSVEQLGETLFKMLEYCKLHPYWNVEVKGDINKQLGVKDDRTFFRDHVCVLVRWESENRGFVFTPTLQEKKGFSGVKEKQLQIGDSSTNEAVGHELLRAISEC